MAKKVLHIKLSKYYDDERATIVARDIEASLSNQYDVIYTITESEHVNLEIQ